MHPHVIHPPPLTSLTLLHLTSPNLTSPHLTPILPHPSPHPPPHPTPSHPSPPLTSLPPTPTSRHPTPSPHPRTPPPHVPPHVTPGGRRNLETRSRQKGRGRVPQGVGDRSERGARRCTSSDSHNQIYLHLHHKYKYKYKCPKSIFVAAKKRKNWGRIGENHRLDSSHSHEKTWSGRDVWLQIRGDQQ